jgi:hypothetical protein
VEKLKFPGFDQIPAELIEAGDKRLRFHNQKFINVILSKSKFPQQWKESIIRPIYKKCAKTH